MSPKARYKAAELLQTFGLSERRACKLAGAPRSTVRYRSVKPKDTALRKRIRELADRHRRFGHLLPGRQAKRRREGAYKRSAEARGLPLSAFASQLPAGQ